jgi:hypothetical protein
MTFNERTANKPTNGSITQNHSGEKINNNTINTVEMNNKTQLANFALFSAISKFFTKLMFLSGKKIILIFFS